MGTHVTRYETKGGKTRRVKNPTPGTPGTPEPTATPKNNGVNTTQTPDSKPAKQGA
jgi:hypothetical protein